MWGHLIPLSPFIQGDVNASQENDSFAPIVLKPLELPGSFGREELLRPFSKVCPTCSLHSRRRRGNSENTPLPKKKRTISSTTLCNICQSIQSMAKFIPRKSFWRFSYAAENSNNSNETRLLLSISGKNSSQLVRICSASGDNIRESNNNLQKDLVQQIMEVNDGDIISLLWNNGEGRVINASSHTLAPLVQFQLARAKDDVTENADAYIMELADNQVVVPLLIEADKDTTENKRSHSSICNSKTEVEKTPDNNEIAKTYPAEEENDGKAVCNSNDIRQSKKHDDCDKNDDTSSSSSSDDEHLWNAGGFLKTVTKEEKVARGNYFRDVRAKHGHDRRDSKKQQKMASQPDSSSHNSVKQNCQEDASFIGSVNDSNKCEEESESAPLTLPSRFLASYSRSFSFDSAEKSPSQSAKGSGDCGAEYSGQIRGTPEKSNQNGKRSYEDVEATNRALEATKTPKKSNVTHTDTNISTPISSLSYDQLVQLHKDSKPTSSTVHPSLRHAVLSLTLALTSNASSYDSNFLRDCNHAEAITKSGTNINGQQTSSPQHGRQQWMPRLLQGTQIKKWQ